MTVFRKIETFEFFVLQSVETSDAEIQHQAHLISLENSRKIVWSKKTFFADFWNFEVGRFSNFPKKWSNFLKITKFVIFFLKSREEI